MRTRITRPRLGAYRSYQRYGIQRFEQAALNASNRGATIAKGRLRAAFSSARLGRLGYAIGSGSDLRKGSRVRKVGNGFSASGWLFIRSRSERTLGAIEAYTEGAEIRPRKGRWLWIATDMIPPRVGKYRMTPERYAQSGLVEKIGPLIMIDGRASSEKLLIVRNVTTRKAGRANARRMPKKGKIRAGREAQEQIIAFVGIRRTSRQARVNARSIIGDVQRQMPQLIAQSLGNMK